MKKTISLILAFVLCLSLCACGKSEAVKKVEAAIDAIGEVTAYSNEAITRAEELYEFLTDKEKEQVSNRLALFEARTLYENNKSQLHIRAKEAYDLIIEAYNHYKLVMDDILMTRATALSLDAKRIKCTASNIYSVFASSTKSFSAEEFMQAAKEEQLDAATLMSDYLLFQKVIERAIDDRGDFEIIGEKLSNAETILKELGKGYGDTFYYPTLEEYYSEMNRGFIFVKERKYGKFDHKHYPFAPEEPKGYGEYNTSGWGVYYNKMEAYQKKIDLLFAE